MNENPSCEELRCDSFERLRLTGQFQFLNETLTVRVDESGPIEVAQV